MKSLGRLLAFDDGAFAPGKSRNAPLVGVLSRLDNRVEGIVSERIRVDGWDSTTKLLKLVRQTRFGFQAHFLLLSGITFAGFNIADIERLNRETKKPVLVVFRKRPSLEKIRLALQRLSNPSKRWRLFERAGPVFSAKEFHFQCIGMPAEEAGALLQKLCNHGNLPEPLRLAHLVASGVSLGESTRPK